MIRENGALALFYFLNGPDARLTIRLETKFLGN